MTASRTDPALLSEEQLREHAVASLTRSRRRTTALADAVDDEDLLRQHSPLMSPLIWDYAHVANQEELWLVRDVGGREAVNGDIDEIYDAFANARSIRPTLPLLGPAQARAYVDSVRGKVLDVIASAPLSGRRLTEAGFAFGMVTQHEQQHAETMLATHQLRITGTPLAAPPPPAALVHELPAEVVVPGGPFTMGTSTEAWALDNERPGHSVDVSTFAIDTVPVTNGRYREFVEAGGYDQQQWWTPAGWAHRHEEGLVAPLFWERDTDGSWWRRRFGTTVPLADDQPVVHVCFHEAEAFAAWAGRRLPTEAEWEKAARFDPATGRSRRFPWGDDDPSPTVANLGQTYLEPAPVGAYPAGVSPLGVHQLIGDVWEWTSTPFAGYPGFEVFPYDEYSKVFFGGDYQVLRGGSFGTDTSAIRATFRNWDFPIRRQIFAGFRTAHSVASPGSD